MGISIERKDKQIIIVKDLTIDYAIHLYNDFIINKETDACCFDFSNVSYYCPFSMIICGIAIKNIIINNKKTIFSLRWNNNDIKSSRPAVFGFFRFIEINIGNMPINNNIKNYIPITIISFSNLNMEKSIEDIISEQSKKLALKLCDNNEQIIKTTSFVISEIIRNCQKHSNSEVLYICGQYSQSKEEIEIAIVDEGIGIYNSLSKKESNREKIKNNKDALINSLIPGVSESYNLRHGVFNLENIGFGLYMVSEICENNNGLFCMISGNNYVKIEKNKRVVGVSKFSGTAICIKINAKKLNYQSMIDKYSREGKEYIKKARNNSRNNIN